MSTQTDIIRTAHAVYFAAFGRHAKPSLARSPMAYTCGEGDFFVKAHLSGRVDIMERSILVSGVHADDAMRRWAPTIGQSYIELRERFDSEIAAMAEAAP